MNVILLGGGAGTRLWPLSNDVRSKQYVQLLKTEQGEAQSLIQRIWSQLQQTGLATETIIATNKTQQHILKRQLGNDVPLLLEPARRDTFPAIALAATKLLHDQTLNITDTILVLPSDTYADTAFYEKAQQLAQNIQSSSTHQIGLLTVEPTFPSTEYGYMLTNNSVKTLAKGQKFIEKPTLQKATELIAQGAKWNSGVFALKVELILQTLKQLELPTAFNELYEAYENLPKISFDYAVLQQCNEIAALQYEGQWDDLGSWKAVLPHVKASSASPNDPKNTIKNSPTSVIINELHYPITLIDVPDCIVVASHDGVLIASQQSTANLKALIPQQKVRPMYEERQWGTYTVLQKETLAPNLELLIKRLTIEKHQNISYQKHAKRSEVWTVIKGEGLLAHNDRIKPVKPGTVIQIHAGEMHAIYAITDLEIVEVQYGSQLIEEDIERTFYSWNEIEQHIQLNV